MTMQRERSAAPFDRRAGNLDSPAETEARREIQEAAADWQEMQAVVLQRKAARVLAGQQTQDQTQGN